MLHLYSSGGASDFALDGEALHPDEASQVLEAVARLLERRDQQEAAQILRDVPFVIYRGHNTFNDSFDVLFASVDMDEYERLREFRESRGRAPFQDIANTVSELGHGVRHVAVDLTLQPTSPRVGQPSDSIRPKREPTFWTARHFRLFLSHCSSIKAPAAALQAALHAHGISAFVAHADIEPTREWEEEIQLALESMDCLAALLTKDFPSSLWCDQEVGVALGRGCLVLPIKIDLDPYGFIARTQAITAAGVPLQTIAMPIARALLLHRATAPKYTSCLADALGYSESFSMAKVLTSLLEQCSTLSRAEAGRLIEAIESNSQVHAAYGVPSRIQALVRKHGCLDLVP